jgi:hypothetical protein
MFSVYAGMRIDNISLQAGDNLWLWVDKLNLSELSNNPAETYMSFNP